jgi:hypothetical protein
MKRSTYWLMAVLLLGALLLPQPAAADVNWKTSNAYWKQRDNCTRAAQKQFPDYTAEAVAKRTAARQKCLRASNQPEGEPEPAQPPQPTPR